MTPLDILIGFFIWLCKSEIFVLCLKGAQDNKWFQKASQGLEYIEINEQELDLVLNHQPLNKKIRTSSGFNGLRY